MTLRDIIAGLPELTADDLSVVIATASQLKAVKSGSAQGSRGNRGRMPASKRQSKGPAQQVSPWKDIPEYLEFKSANKELHVLLKRVNLSLKQAKADPTVRDDPVLVRFQTAQAVWFRRKAELTPKVAKSGPAQGKAPSITDGTLSD
jgi:hypothetical protein